MARIRTIKPEFWQDHDVGKLPALARLLFIGTWNVAEDEGLLRWSPAYLRSAIFPYDDIDLGDVHELMVALERSGRIVAYEADGGEPLAYIPNFAKHQTIDRPFPSRLPLPPVELVGEDFHINHRSIVERSTSDRRKGGEHSAINRSGNGNGNGNRDRSRPTPTPTKNVGVGVGLRGSSTKDVEEPLPTAAPSPVAAAASKANGQAHPTPKAKVTPMRAVKRKVKQKEAVFLTCPYTELIAIYHHECPDNPKVLMMNDNRRAAMQARWREWQQNSHHHYGTPPTEAKAIDFWTRFFAFVNKSPFLTGKATPREGRDPFFADIDFLFSPVTHTKVIEGKYHAQVVEEVAI